MTPSLMTIVRDAATRFARQPRYRASVEMRALDEDQRAKELAEWRRTWGLPP